MNCSQTAKNFKKLKTQDERRQARDGSYLFFISKIQNFQKKKSKILKKKKKKKKQYDSIGRLNMVQF